MRESFYEVSGSLEGIIFKEKPNSVLEVSGYSPKYGRLIADSITRNVTTKTGKKSNSTKKKAYVDRIDLVGNPDTEAWGVYRQLLPPGLLHNPQQMEQYDLIVIMNLFENMEAQEAKSLLEGLVAKANKAVLVVTPEYPYDINTQDALLAYRPYHPVFFRGFDFSYQMLPTVNENIQLYLFYPPAFYEPMAIDRLPPSIQQKKQLRIAYILPHQNLTGGLKALLQQMKELTKIGHHVGLYYKSDDAVRAIPSWSHLTDDDVHRQIIVPMKQSYLSYIKEADVIIVGWMQQLPEFIGCTIPVVLWEQGSEMIYGDYGKLLPSVSRDRMTMHYYYRLPVHLLSVSTTIQEILKGVYGRESQLFPNGIDTGFYHPGEKNNAVPVILLVGSPYLAFKGFSFALKVLSNLFQSGRAFEVWWASQSDFDVGAVPYPLKKHIAVSQEKLAALYRQADLFLSPSLYESFPLPPMEAMASGTAVVATDSGGIQTYARPGKNCLMAEQSDANSTFAALAYLLDHPQERDRLASAGRETALEYSFDKVTKTLEECLYRVVEAHRTLPGHS